MNRTCADTVLCFPSANAKRSAYSEALEERRLQILSLSYGKRSLRYLLEETKLRDCDLLGGKESTDDGDNKFLDWQDVPLPRKYISPKDTTPVLGSPVQSPKRTRSEHEGIIDRMYRMYSSTLLNTHPNQLVSCPKYPHLNFFRWANPDYIVHRYEEGLRRWQIMYSSTDVTDNFLDQYGTNMDKIRDLCHLTITPNDFPSTLSEPEPEPTTEPEPVSDLQFRQLPSS